MAYSRVLTEPGPAVGAAPPLLAVEGLSVTLGAARRRVLSDVSFSIGVGGRLGLVGASGSGKSVTLQVLMGLLGLAPGGGRIEAGQLWWRPPGQPPTDLATLSEAGWRRLRGRQLAMIFQEPATALNPLMTVGAQVAEGLPPALRGAARRARAVELLDEVRLPEPGRIGRRYPHQLSGGQRQRVMIAMALGQDPALLLADEPTTALDATTQQGVLELVDGICRARGMALLLVSHDLGVVARLCPQVVQLAGGRVVARGPAQVAPPRATLAAPAAAPAPPRLAVSGLSVALGRGSAQRQVLSEVSLTLAAGQALAVVGESGSGKTTLARAILRLEAPQAGRITLEGADWLALRGAALRRARRALQLVAQDPFAALNPRLTVRQMLTEPLAVHRLCAPAERPARVRALLDQVQLPTAALDHYPHAFSGGQRQRLCIARALALEPRVLIADEALSALDAAVQDEVIELLHGLVSGQRLSLLFITHDLAAARRLCQQALVLHRGRVVEQGPVAELLATPRKPYTQQLVAAARWANPQL